MSKMNKAFVVYKMKFSCRETFSDSDKPVLIIQGRQDITGDGVAYEAHGILKNSSMVFINECVHYGWLEQREQYKTAVEKFITSVRLYPEPRMEVPKAQ